MNRPLSPHRTLTGSWAGCLVFIFTLFSLAGVAGFLVGVWRYDGPAGLWRRLQAEIAPARPHAEFVPTPLAAPAISFPLATKTPTLVPTPNPTLPPTPTLIAITSTVPLSLAGVVLTPTVVVSPTATTPPPAPTATPTLAVPPPAGETIAATFPPTLTLPGITHMWQRWNNCGPATLAMNLSYFGLKFEQAAVANVLKPNPDDKNVNPAEMVAFAQSQGLLAYSGINGSPEMLRRLLYAGWPVLIETWLESEPNDGMGHYRLVTGYDAPAGEWIVYDTYVSKGVPADKPYAGIRMTEAELNQLWPVFNRTYLVVYRPAEAATVEGILAEAGVWPAETMWAQALAQAEAEVTATPADPYRWFNLGSDLVAAGRYDEAAAAYDQARRLKLPWRMLWYQFGPFQAYYETGRYPELLALTEATIASGGEIEEIYYWHGQGLLAQGDTAGARAAWQKAVALNPSYGDAGAALANLPQP